MRSWIPLVELLVLLLKPLNAFVDLFDVHLFKILVYLRIRSHIGQNRFRQTLLQILILWNKRIDKSVLILRVLLLYGGLTRIEVGIHNVRASIFGRMRLSFIHLFEIKSTLNMFVHIVLFLNRFGAIESLAKLLEMEQVQVLKPILLFEDYAWIFSVELTLNSLKIRLNIQMAV